MSSDFEIQISESKCTVVNSGLTGRGRYWDGASVKLYLYYMKLIIEAWLLQPQCNSEAKDAM